MKQKSGKLRIISMKRINIRQDLINKELKSDIQSGYIYYKFNLHNSLISKLYHHYDCIEMYENFYDSEPNYDDETHNMYMDYIKDQNCNFTFSEMPHAKEELKEAYYTILKQQEEYEGMRSSMNPAKMMSGMKNGMSMPKMPTISSPSMPKMPTISIPKI